MKTSVYIDGFNLYSGCFKQGRYGTSRCSPAGKWLNLRLLADTLAEPAMHYPKPEQTLFAGGNRLPSTDGLTATPD